jgi:hypothetical protein
MILSKFGLIMDYMAENLTCMIIFGESPEYLFVVVAYYYYYYYY